MEIRQQLRRQRQALSVSARHLAAYCAFLHFLKLPFLNEIQHIAIYKAFEGEMDPENILLWCWKKHKRCYLPLIPSEKTKKVMQFAYYDKKSVLTLNRFRILEPENTQKMPAEEMDLILLPLVAFTRSGYRLGMGQGFYDATLHALGVKQTTFSQTRMKKPFLLGFGYAFQEIENIIPHAKDIKMDGIVTDKELILEK